MKHLDLFSGIGGFALATEMVWPQVEHIFCDNEKFSQAILKKHWPDATIYGDIRSLTFDSYADGHGRSGWGTKIDPAKAGQQAFDDSPRRAARLEIDLLTGGFPCQPFSQAGRRLGTEDDRHLWPEMLRVIREFHPCWVIGENVGGLVTWDGGVVLEQIHADMEGEGYEVQSFIIPAVSLNAPHRRDRVWIVANRQHQPEGNSKRRGNDQGTSTRTARPDTLVTDSSWKRRQQKSRSAHGDESTDERRPAIHHHQSASKNESDWNASWLEVATRLCTLDDGLPNGLARPRGWRNAALKGAGNAIVPQVAAQIMRAIYAIENL